MPDDGPTDPGSLMNRFMGNRSLFRWIFGSFFTKPSNTSGLLALVLVVSSLAIYVKRGTVPDWLRDAVFIVIGFYFGGIGHQKPDSDQD